MLTSVSFQPLILSSCLLFIVSVTAQSAYCDSVVGAISLCEELTTGFDNLEPTQQASCLCGTSLSTLAWGPSSFDLYIGSCYHWAETVDPADASTFSDLQNFCASNYVTPTAAATSTYGQPAAKTTSTYAQATAPTRSTYTQSTLSTRSSGIQSAAPTPSISVQTSSTSLSAPAQNTVTQAQDYSYCMVLNNAVSFCERSTAGFDSLKAAQQASCLCASSMATLPWGPSSFDSVINGCYSYEVTARLAGASSLSELQNFCARNYATAEITAASTPTVTNQPFSIVTIAIAATSSIAAVQSSNGVNSETSVIAWAALILPILLGTL